MPLSRQLPSSVVYAHLVERRIRTYEDDTQVLGLRMWVACHYGAPRKVVISAPIRGE